MLPILSRRMFTVGCKHLCLEKTNAIIEYFLNSIEFKFEITTTQ